MGHNYLANLEFQDTMIKCAADKNNIWFTESAVEEAVLASSELFKNAKKEIIWLRLFDDIQYGNQYLWQHLTFKEAMSDFLARKNIELHVIFSALERYSGTMIQEYFGTERDKALKLLMLNSSISPAPANALLLLFGKTATSASS